MKDAVKKILINNMTDNLPTLRKKLELSQDELASLIGISRSTVSAIENKKREMSWNIFLSLVLIFSKNKETGKLLYALDIYTEDLNEFLETRIKAE